MKIRKCIFAIALLGSLVAISPMCQAAEGDAQPGARQGQRRNLAPEERVKQLDEQAKLSLTDKQKADLKVLYKEEADKMKEIRDNTSLSAEERRTKMQDLRKESDVKLKKILTAEQAEKYDKYVKERQQRGRRQQGQ